MMMMMICIPNRTMFQRRVQGMNYIYLCNPINNDQLLALFLGPQSHVFHYKMIIDHDQSNVCHPQHDIHIPIVHVQTPMYDASSSILGNDIHRHTGIMFLSINTTLIDDPLLLHQLQETIDC